MSNGPEWKLVNGRTRCNECGALVPAAWTLFVRPGVWTLCYCEACTTKLTNTPA